MKAKKVFACMMAAGLIIPAAAGSVSAAEQQGQTPVTYDNRNYIPDPDNPDSPEWAVTIPSAIDFTDDNKDIDASVALVALHEGATLPANDVTVTVTSANEYKLKNGDAQLSYALIYGDTVMTDTATEVAKLNSNSVTKSGHAVLGNDKAPKRGSYADTLNYTISTTTQQ